MGAAGRGGCIRPQLSICSRAGRGCVCVGGVGVPCVAEV